MGYSLNEFLTLAEEIKVGQLAYPFSNEDLSPSDLHARIAEDAITHRTNRLAKFTGNTDVAKSQEKLDHIFRRLAFDNEGNKRPIKDFEKELYAIYGSVFTGHPVSNMNADMAGKLSDAANQRGKEKQDPQAIATADEALRNAMKSPFESPTLETESQASLKAISSVHQANDYMIQAAMKVAQDLYPDEWSHINYMPTTIATWIPFDWDGRTDVDWPDLMEKRIELQVLMLKRYGEKLEAILPSLTDEEDRLTVRNIQSRLSDTSSKMTAHQKFFGEYNPKEDADGVALSQQYDQFKNENRITDPQELIAQIDGLLTKNQDQATQEQLVHLRSDLVNHGLSFAQIHFRLNAKSIQSALREEGLPINADIKDPEKADEAYFSQLSEMVDKVEYKKPSLLDLRYEQETVVKQMAMISEFDEHIEQGRNTRFLIAETDRAIVPLGALYFAKKMGIHNKINISGLCEDRAGQDNFKRLSNLLLTNPDYKDHIITPRTTHPLGMAMEADMFGYSDSGRYDGVIGAGAHMERAKGQKQKVLQPLLVNGHTIPLHMYNFETGGQYAGRGFHPLSPASDMQYKQSGFLMHNARELGIKLTPEISYQGMDGNAFLLNPDMALSHLTQRLDYLTDFDLHKKLANDPYYKKEGLRTDAFNFFETVRNAHAKGTTEKGYVDFIESFMGHGYKYGSRPAKRAKASGGDRDLPRAIVHNATLKRAGIAFNLLDGVREAIEEDPARFENLMKSEIFRDNYIHMVQHGLEQAIPGVMQADVELYNPEFWRARGNESVAIHVERIGIYNGIKDIADKMQESLDALTAYFKERDLLPAQDPKTKFNRRVLQGHRVASTIKLFEKAVEIPDIPNSYDLSREEAIDRLFKGDLTVVDELRKIYPVSDSPNAPEGSGYDHLQHEVITPLAENIDDIRACGNVLAHYDGAVG